MILKRWAELDLHDLLSVKSGVFKLLSCSHHTTQRDWSTTGGNALHKLVTTLSPNDSILSTNHVLSRKITR